jgi:CubicO group peptidase (beta-lactamase class C family)
LYRVIRLIPSSRAASDRSGQTYERFVQENIFQPIGMKRAALAWSGKYAAGAAIRHLPGSMVELPAPLLPMVDSAGAWYCSVVDMARFLTNLDGTRGKPVLSEKSRKLMVEPPQKPLKLRDNNTFFGLGWDVVLNDAKGVMYFKDGCYQGIRAFMKRTQGGLNWVLCFDASMDFDPIDTQIAANSINEIRQVIEKIEKQPNVDLFKEYD